MLNDGSNQILEVRGGDALETFKALALESRLAILQLLAAGDRNINELGACLGVSQPTVSRHIQHLEQVGLVVSEYMPGTQGMQKRCRLRCGRLIVNFDAATSSEEKVEAVSMPLGLYTLANPSGTCGLANSTKFIGFLDKGQSFYDPDRASAQILWMAQGFVEYIFPNDLPTSMDIDAIEIQMEVCSEAPDHNADWPSDITVWMNGVEVGTWTSPGDFGGKRGLLTPDWWPEHMTQFGMLKVWSVDATGSYVDGNRVSNTCLSDLNAYPQQPITIRIGVKPDAENGGGFNLFGRGFGNYSQDLVLRLHYAARRDRSQKANPDLRKEPVR